MTPFGLRIRVARLSPTFRQSQKKTSISLLTPFISGNILCSTHGLANPVSASFHLTSNPQNILDYSFTLPKFNSKTIVSLVSILMLNYVHSLVMLQIFSLVVSLDNY